jgi:hypothetical protein
MIRRAFLRRLVLVSVGLVGSAAVADPVDDILEEIRSQGFRIVRVQRTWLGRVQIVGQNASFRREVVIDPTTGEIRRDLLIPRERPGEPSAPPAESPAESGSLGGAQSDGEAGGWGGGWGSRGDSGKAEGNGAADAR